MQYRQDGKRRDISNHMIMSGDVVTEKPGYILFGEGAYLAEHFSRAHWRLCKRAAEIAILDLRTDSSKRMDRFQKFSHRFEIILALVNENDNIAISMALAAGATHVMSSPFHDDMLLAQIRAIENSLASDRLVLETDSLTGLKTAASARRTLSDWLFKDARVMATICGLRRFENVNATFGAASGDAILRNVGQQIRDFAQHSVGENILVSRFGGRDFLIATTDEIDRRKWQLITTELLEIITQPLAMQDKIIRLTARASLAKSTVGEDAQSYIGRLAHALADAHQQDAHRIKWADRASDAVPESGYQLEADLLHSIERDQIRIGLQPQFCVETGDLIGAEALAKWEHGELGEIGAATLFALAERTDFTEHLSRHIGTLAIDHAARWPQNLAHLRLSLNVTAQQLASPRFVESQQTALTKSGFDAERLTLEITESALIGNLKTASDLLAQVRRLGIKIAIDDFGTGYSNFLYLKSLPLDYIKLDHAMIRDIATGPRDRVIVRSIIALAQALELGVIAEGVETEAQLEVLKEEGCQFYQGFLRAKSMSPKEFEAFAHASG